MGLNTSTTFLSSSIQIPDDAYLTPCLYWENFENEYSRDSVNFSTTKELVSGTKVIAYSNNKGYPFEYTLPFTMNPGDTIRVKDIVSTKFFLGTNDAIWMTMGILDFGEEPEWFNISNKANSGLDGLVQAMGMSKDANFLFAGTQEGQLYRLTSIKFAYDYDRADARSPYCLISTTEIPLIDPVTMTQNTQVITSVYVDPEDDNHVIVTLGNYGNENYVFRSTNALAENPTFTSIQGNLPYTPVYSCVIEMSESNTAIIGTDMGMYISTDISSASPTWALVESEIGNCPVFEIRQQLIRKEAVVVRTLVGEDTINITYPGTQNYGAMYAASYGRGLHYTSIFEKPVGIFNPGVEHQVSSLVIYPNPVSHQATIEYSLEEKTELIITVFDINGRMIVNEKLSQDAGTHQYKFDCSALPRGTYISSIHTGQTVMTGKFIVTH